MSDGINSILIILTILILVGLLSITINISKIKTNWKEYQCNPIFIPFSSIFSSKSASETFNVCISNYVKNFMNIFIQPFMNMFDMFIEYGEMIFGVLENFKNLVNIFEFNILDFQKYFKEIILKVINVIEGVLAGIEVALRQIEVLLTTLQESYLSMLSGTESLLNDTNLGTLIMKLENL
tara:strand:- start:3791 stop:4330 length:540 start_codon:yes stop_codon:yes gene_type:complete